MKMKPLPCENIHQTGQLVSDNFAVKCNGDENKRLCHGTIEELVTLALGRPVLIEGQGLH